MRNLLFSLFAISVASVAAMTATTALLNAPQRPAQVVETAALVDPPEGPASGSKPATTEGAPPATPSGTPDPAKPPNGTADGKTGTAAEGDEADKDPYEGIAEEELPPDLQYSADSSVSFPTNI
jgi:hypothetical protein